MGKSADDNYYFSRSDIYIPYTVEVSWLLLDKSPLFFTNFIRACNSIPFSPGRSFTTSGHGSHDLILSNAIKRKTSHTLWFFVMFFAAFYHILSMFEEARSTPWNHPISVLYHYLISTSPLLNQIRSLKTSHSGKGSKMAITTHTTVSNNGNHNNVVSERKEAYREKLSLLVASMQHYIQRAFNTLSIQRGTASQSITTQGRVMGQGKQAGKKTKSAGSRVVKSPARNP